MKVFLLLAFLLSIIGLAVIDWRIALCTSTMHIVTILFFVIKVSTAEVIYQKIDDNLSN